MNISIFILAVVGALLIAVITCKLPVFQSRIGKSSEVATNRIIFLPILSGRVFELCRLVYRHDLYFDKAIGIY